MQALEKTDIEYLLLELGEYWKSLWDISSVSEEVFEIINTANGNTNTSYDHKVWVKNTMDLRRFPMLDKILDDNVFSHQLRLFQILKELTYFFNIINQERPEWDKIDLKYALNLASIHDDTEWVNPFKDIPTIIKISLSDKAKEILDEVEIACIEILSKNQSDHLKIESTEDLKSKYLDSLNKNSMEWQLVSYLDKVDWFMYCVHEIFAWNKQFLSPFQDYVRFLTEIRDNKSKYPKIRYLIDGDKNDFEKKVTSWFPYNINRILSKQELTAYSELNRRKNAVKLFDIDSLLTIVPHVLDIHNNSETNLLVDKKPEYRELIINDSKNHLNKLPLADIYTTQYEFYEAWKIAYAKIWYQELNWNIKFWFDMMYPKST